MKIDFEITNRALELWSRTAYNKADEHTITILDPIGADYFGEGVTAKRISAALRAIGDNPVTVIINSPGGSLFEGLSIYELLAAHTQQVTVKVLGLAASAASLPLLAADKVEIGKASFVMIHEAHAIAYGTSGDMQSAADRLKKFDKALVKLYSEKTGKSAKDVQEMLAAETWFNADEALEIGLADAIVSQPALESEKATNAIGELDKVLAKAGISRTNRRRMYKNIKSEIIGMPSAASEDTPSAVTTINLEPLPKVAFINFKE